ncbi:MAG TPA: amidase [Gemmataceae bacterium]|nr:amidase [Gemmataceae bacterium]
MTNDDAPFTITAAAERIRRSDLSPVELLDTCLARIDRYEDRVKAWAYLDRDGAREQAERLTAELKRGQNRGPLHGIPLGIKDIIDVFDMPTGCGSKRWANSYARRDATCVERLRQAGAVILGKTVTTSYASFDPPPTRNPWNLDRTPGGSSSGSAAAVACGMCLGALATQTGGSITRPASYCGVYSLKPSHGRVSVDGVLPLAPSLDHVGAMANSVRDLAILLQPIARTDADEVPAPYHYLAEIDHHRGYERHRELAALPDFLPGRTEPVMARAFERLQEITEDAGWAWCDLPLPPAFGDVHPHHHNVMAVEAAGHHGERMRRYPDDYPPRARSLIEHGQSVSAPEYATTLEHFRSLREEIESSFVEVWRVFCLPATSGPAPTAETTGDPAFNAPWSYVGLPTVSLPFAWTENGLPLAVQLTGDRWCEDDLLAVAAMLEETIGFERRPLPL